MRGQFAAILGGQLARNIQIYIAPVLELSSPDPTFIPGARQAFIQKSVWLVQGNQRAITDELLSLKVYGYKIKGLIVDSHGDHGSSIQIGERKYSLDPNQIRDGAVTPVGDPFLKELGQYLDGDIVLLGCQVGVNEKLMTEIAKATGKTIVASEGWNANWPGMFNDPSALEDPMMNTIIQAVVRANFDQVFNMASKEEQKQIIFAMLIGSVFGADPQEIGVTIMSAGVKIELIKMMEEGISPSGAPPIYNEYDPVNGSSEERRVHSRVGVWKKAHPDGTIEPVNNTIIFNPDGSYRTSDKPFYQMKFGQFYRELYKQRFGGGSDPANVPVSEN